MADILKEEPLEPKDFWCVVAFMAVPGSSNEPNGVCPILTASEDAKAVDLIIEGDWFDNGGSAVWCKDKKPGVYKLRMRPWSHGPDMGGEHDFGIDAWEVKLLYEFTDDDLR